MERSIAHLQELVEIGAAAKELLSSVSPQQLHPSVSSMSFPQVSYEHLLRSPILPPLSLSQLASSPNRNMNMDHSRNQRREHVEELNDLWMEISLVRTLLLRQTKKDAEASRGMGEERNRRSVVEV